MNPKTVPLAMAVLASLAPAQGANPLYVTDSTNDTVWRLEDLDQNGDFNAAGETSVFYDDALGAITLTNNNGITLASGGRVFFTDSSEDICVLLQDLNDDGDALDGGEATVYFDGTAGGNLSGVVMTSAANLFVDDQDVVWIASSNTSSGNDAIIRLEDLSDDGDCNDVGEAVEWYLPAPGGSTGDSLPQDVRVGLDGAVYYLEAGSTGVLAKGVYRLVDSDDSGSIDPGEVMPWFLPAAQANSAFFWGFAEAEDGYWYMADSSNELVWRFRDEDASGSVDPATEALVYWQSAGSSLIWNVDVGRDGALYCAESQSPDRVLRMFDGDGNSSIDASEVSEVYSEDLSPADIGNPRSLAADNELPLPLAYCTAKASTAGCLASMTTSDPAALPVSGAADYSVVVTAMEGQRPGIFFTGLTPAATPFLGGTLCIQPPIKRSLNLFSFGTSGACDGSYAMLVNDGNVIPAGFDAGPGATSFLQAWYRDPLNPDGTGAALSDGLELVWQ